MAEDFFRKVSDSRDGLEDAAANAVDLKERQFASRATSVPTMQLVLHLEPYAGPAAKLFPRDPTTGVLQKLKQLFGGLDSQPLVLNIANTRRADVPWAVS